MKRKLGINEISSLYINKIVPHNLVVTIAIKGQVSPKTIALVLNSLQYKHPLLRACVKKKSFVSEENKIKVRVRVINKKTQWEREIEKELAWKFKLDKAPLLRVGYIRGQDNKTFKLIITFHHIISDGISSVYFAEELLLTVENILYGKNDFTSKPYPERLSADDLSSKADFVGDLSISEQCGF